MRPASLVLCVSSLAQGGAERVIAWLADALASRGHRVLLVTAAGREHDFYDPPRAADRTSLADDFGVEGGGLASISALRRVFRERRPDAVVSFLPRTSIAAVIAGRLAGVPVIVSERNDPRREVLPTTTRIGRILTYPFARGVAMQTSRPADWVRRRAPFARLAVIPNPVRPLQRPAGVTREPVVLGMGRLVPAKRFDRLIRAFCAIAPARPQLRLRIVGDGPLRAELADQVARSGFADRIEMLGITRDVETEFARASVFVLSSDFEGFPNVLAEAMSVGTPVVSVDCPTGPAEMIEDGSSGLLVPQHDEEALAAAIGRIVDESALAQRLGCEATRISERFSPESVLDQWEHYLGTVIGADRVADAVRA